MAALEAAELVLLLVSPDFMNSHHRVGIEMARALERAVVGEAQVMPIILRPCDWTSSEIDRLKALPTDAQPFIKFPTLDEGFKTANAFMKNYLYAANPGGLDSDLRERSRRDGQHQRHARSTNA